MSILKQAFPNMGDTKADSENDNANPEEQVEDVLDYDMDWSDMRMFDNLDASSAKAPTPKAEEVTDNSGGWYEEEGRQMCLEYGKFIQVCFSTQLNSVTYNCEICKVLSNSRTSLKIHCNGMKHLKKKKQWDDERDNSDKGGPSSPAVKEDSDPPLKRPAIGVSTEEPKASTVSIGGYEQRGSMTRGNSHTYGVEGSRGRDYGEKMPRGGNSLDKPRGRGYDGGLPDTHEDDTPRGRGYGDQKGGRGYGDGSYGRGYGEMLRGRGSGDGSYGRGYGERHRGRGFGDGSYGRGYGAIRGRGSFAEPRGRPYASRKPYDRMPDYEAEANYYKPPSEDIPPTRDNSEKSLPWDMDLEEAATTAGVGTNGSEIRESSSMERQRGRSYSRLELLKDESSSVGLPYANPSRQWSDDPPARRPVIDDILPNRFRQYSSQSPIPKKDENVPIMPPSPPKVDLRSSKGVSLAQLSKISILSAEDAKVGVGVVSSVLKSLKNFYQVKCNWKAVDLLIDAELKIGSVAALETTATCKRVGSTSPRRERHPY